MSAVLGGVAGCGLVLGRVCRNMLIRWLLVPWSIGRLTLETTCNLLLISMCVWVEQWVCGLSVCLLTGSLTWTGGGGGLLTAALVSMWVGVLVCVMLVIAMMSWVLGGSGGAFCYARAILTAGTWVLGLVGSLAWVIMLLVVTTAIGSSS